MGVGRGKIERVLIANRGEIAVRVLRACKDLGISAVAAYADADKDALFVTHSDAAISLEGNKPSETYLCGEKLIQAAVRTGCDALHPGYGFLSEDANFAEAVIQGGLVWVGPPPDAIRTLGNKVVAREIARSVGAKLVPGTNGPPANVEEAEAFVGEYGLPVVIKAAYGGGGRGMRVVRSREGLAGQFDAAQREATLAFGKGDCFVERYMDEVRHVEAQILADHHGGIVMVGTRDCTLQRRHQKVVEEAPAPFLTLSQEHSISKAAKDICRAAGYVGAGTVEFLVERGGDVFFLEVNTRLQVEHPVTEETAGVDLVCEQFRIAAGEPLRWTDDLVPRGHSVEFRINAEDPGKGFLPAPGPIRRFRIPGGPGVRVDSGVEAGSVVDGNFDSLLAKLIVTGEDRPAALRRARRALAEFDIEGLPTLLPFHRAIVNETDFNPGDGESFSVHTDWIESSFIRRHEILASETVGSYGDASIEIGGRQLLVRLPEGTDVSTLVRSGRGGTLGRLAKSSDAVLSPMQGVVISVSVSEGQVVEVGDLLVVVEAMKMENGVFAHRAGVVRDVAVHPGQTLRQGLIMCRVKNEADGRADDLTH